MHRNRKCCYNLGHEHCNTLSTTGATVPPKQSKNTFKVLYGISTTYARLRPAFHYNRFP
jgi:hypothetical protein